MKQPDKDEGSSGRDETEKERIGSADRHAVIR